MFEEFRITPKGCPGMVCEGVMSKGMLRKGILRKGMTPRAGAQGDCAHDAVIRIETLLRGGFEPT